MQIVTYSIFRRQAEKLGKAFLTSLLRYRDLIPGSPGQKSAAKSQKSASGSQKSHLRSQKSDFNINYPLLNIKNFMAFGSYFMY